METPRRETQEREVLEEILPAIKALPREAKDYIDGMAAGMAFMASKMSGEKDQALT